jgi:uncharacterized protein
MIFFRFHGGLPKLLSVGHQAGQVQSRYRGASVKDMIEALGVPHPEVGAIVSAGIEIDFSHLPQDEEKIEVYPLVQPFDVTKATLLRPLPLQSTRFIADINVAKLGRLLRMLGFDTLVPEGHEDAELAAAAAAGGRILLTRDQRLLKRNLVVFGHLVRASYPRDQLCEVAALYGLGGQLEPFSRCMRCNSRLRPVAKEAVLPRLEPLTRKYYAEFKCCPRCEKVYWAGSHRDKMQILIGAIRKECR